MSDSPTLVWLQYMAATDNSETIYRTDENGTVYTFNLTVEKVDEKKPQEATE